MSQPFVVRVFKSFGSRANKTWVNTYEFDVQGEYAEGEMDDPGDWTTPTPVIMNYAINRVVLFEKQIHLPSIQFIYATGSTYKPDSDPYDPSALVTVPLLGTGVRVSPTEALPEDGMLDLRNTAVAARTPTFGKLGKAEYRGCLAEEDVFNSGGKWELTAASDFEVEMAAASTDWLDAVMGLATPGAARMVMIGGTLDKELVPKMEGGLETMVIKRTYVQPYHIRNVNAFGFFKVAVRNLDNKSFDRP